MRRINSVVVIAMLTTGSLGAIQSTPNRPAPEPSVTVASFDAGDVAQRARVLNAIASRDLSASPTDIGRLIGAGLMDSDSSVRLSALSAAASRAAGPRLSNDPQVQATWISERSVLRTLRPLVTDALQDPSPQIRRTALLALGNIALSEGAGRNVLDREALDAFSRTFHSDSDGRVRAEIAKTFALIDNDSPELRVVLERSLDDERSGVRQYGVMGVGRLQIASALPRLVERLSDAEPSVRGAAAAALTRFGPALREHQTAIARAERNEQNPKIREELRRALERIGQ